MKKIFIIIALFLFSIQVYAVEKIYINKPSGIMRPTYNPYGYNQYVNPYRNQYYYQRYNRNNIKRIERLNKIRKLNRIKNNLLSWNFNRNNNGFSNGTLTGYSTPINSNTLQNMDIESLFSKYNSSSSDCNTELFSSPSGNESYYSNGEYYRNNRGLGSKTGVQIIYD